MKPMRFVLIVVLLAVLGGLGFLGYRLWFPQSGQASYDAARQAYTEGAAALAAKDGATAKLKFREAQLLAAQSLDRYDQEVRALKNPSREEIEQLKQTTGRALYLKVLALRDQAYADALAAGKPLPEPTDSTTGKSIRNVLAIPDVPSRNDAVRSLRMAALRSPDDIEIQEDALLVEVQMQPLLWEIVHTIAENVVRKQPDDARALYLLARYDFEQPQIRKEAAFAPPTPADKRSRGRVEQAQKHIERLKTIKDAPLWRTLSLEAQIHQWLAAAAARQGKEADAEREQKKLATLLLDERTGALKRAAAGEGLRNLSTWDADGVLGIHLFALETALAENRKTGTAGDKVARVVADTVAFCRNHAKDIPALTPAKLAATLVSTLALAEGTLALDRDEAWQAAVAATRTALSTALEQKVADPGTIAQFTDVLLHSAAMAGKRKLAKRQAELRAEARTWVDKGLAACTERKLSAEQALPLHMLAAEMKLEGGRDAIGPHLKALYESKQPAALALANLLDGTLERGDGRMEKAREKLEKVVETYPGAGQDLRANIALCGVYLALGEPEKALGRLRLLDRAYERFDALSPQERDWAEQFLGSRADLTGLLVTAHLESARQKAANFVRANPGKAIPIELVKPHEDAAVKLIEKLPPDSSAAAPARRALAVYYGATGRAKEAAAELATLRKHQPDSAELLQLELALLEQKSRTATAGKSAEDAAKEMKSQGDTRIAAFLKEHPADRAGRLLKAAWLTSTRRYDEAMDYLKDPAQFPKRDAAVQRLLVLALLGKGEASEGSAALQALRQDPELGALLPRAGEKIEAKAKDPAKKSTNEGLLKVWEGELALQARRNAEAARGFAAALDYTSARALARPGLQRALLALAQTKPEEARDLAASLLKSHPDQPELLLPYAVACLALDELGQPGDTWDADKTMSAALSAWEKAQLREGRDPSLPPLVRAELWARANRPDQARAEVERALKIAPTNGLALLGAIDLLLQAPPTPERQAEARRLAERLGKTKSSPALLALVDARLDHAEGKTDAAIKALEALLTKEPRQRQAYAYLVAWLTRAKEANRALTWASRWHKEFPNDMGGAAAEVQQLAKAGRLDDARATADAFVATQEKRAVERAGLISAKGIKDFDPKAAVADLRWHLRLELAVALQRGGALKEAETRLDELVKEKPDRVAAQLALGEIYLSRKAWPEAVRLYSSVLKADKHNVIAGNNLGWVLATQLKQPQQALQVLREVSKGRYSGRPLPGDRMHPELLDTLGTVYRLLDRPELYEEMRKLFEPARRRYANDPRMDLHLGLAYAGLQDAPRARQMFDEALAKARAANDRVLSDEQRLDLVRQAEAARKNLLETPPR